MRQGVASQCAQGRWGIRAGPPPRVARTRARGRGRVVVLPARPRSVRAWSALARGLERLHVHVEDLPQVSVRVLEAPAVHETLVLRRLRLDPAGGHGLGGQLVHALPALDGQREDRLVRLAGIGDLLLRELLEERLDRKSVV